MNKKMNVIGINFGEYNSSAVLVKDGLVVSGAPEERFIREKKTKLFPHNSIKFILSENNLTIEDIDFFSQAWNPGEHWTCYNPLISKNRIKIRNLCRWFKSSKSVRF